VIYYSPSVIGQDPHEKQIDIYTDFFHSLHERDLDIINTMGATHIIVSENWSDDGSDEHFTFIGSLAKNKLKLIITFAIPMQNDPILKDSAKSGFRRLLGEFMDDIYSDRLWGFNIPAPDLDEMSEQDVGAYFTLVNELMGLNSEITYKNFVRNISVGFPINTRDGTVPLYCQPPIITPDVWTMDIYGGIDCIGSNLDFMNSYISAFTNQNPTIPPLMAIIKTTSLNGSLSDEIYQLDAFNNIFEYLELNTYKPHIYGKVFFEFSDEWWRSDLSTGGYDVEGCPNSNPFAHTACGITTVFGPYPLEYSGLFGLRDVPLMFCIVPKKIANRIFEVWNPSGNLDTDPQCASIPEVVPLLLYPIIVCVSIIVITLLLVLPTPTPPKVRDRQLQYISDEDLERTLLDRAAPSVNAPNEPSNDSLRTNIPTSTTTKHRIPNMGPKKNENQPLLVTRDRDISIHS